MIHLDQTIAVDGIRQFLKLHTTCGGASLDMPPLPAASGYRALAACRCGDTAEFWVTEGTLPPHQLLAAVSFAAPAAPLPARTPARAARTVA